MKKKQSFKKEIKQWQKELGTEKKLRINLEKKVKNLTDKMTSKASPNLSTASPILLSTGPSNDSSSPEVSCNIGAILPAAAAMNILMMLIIQKPIQKNCYKSRFENQLLDHK